MTIGRSLPVSLLVQRVELYAVGTQRVVAGDLPLGLALRAGQRAPARRGEGVAGEAGTALVSGYGAARAGDAASGAVARAATARRGWGV